jgi:hypothetical protein
MFKLDNLFVIATKDINGKPTIYPRIFTSEEDAKRIADPGDVITHAFINEP